MPSEQKPDQNPMVDIPVKSSMEILSELFNSFDAEPPLIIKKEKNDSPKKSRKNKKKHKHKDKKQKKDKKRKGEGSSSSDRSGMDLAEILIKQEKESSEKKIKIEGTNLSFSLDIKSEKLSDKVRDGHKDQKEAKSDKKKIEITLKTSSLKTDRSKSEHRENLADCAGEQKPKKRKHKSDHSKSKKQKRCGEETTKICTNDLRNKIKANHTSRSKNEFYNTKEKDEDCHREKERESSFCHGRDKERDDDLHKSKDRRHEHRSKDKHKVRENSFYKDSERSKEHDVDKWDRYRLLHDRDRRYRDRSNSRDSSYIDKKKLLEIARRNAIHMMKSGSLPGALTLGPQAQEKVIAAIKAGGKTIEELTDFCKTLSKQEELGDLSSNPDDNRSDSDTDKPFHHPFQIKDRPTSITMNIKNSVPLPLKSTQERSSELRIQFPVSSGQQHRKTESDWVPVAPKKPQPPSSNTKLFVSGTPLAIKAPPPPAAPPQESPLPSVGGPQIIPLPPTESESVDIGSIVSQRLVAMRKLQENPNDVQALTEMYKSNKEMQSWAESKQQPGQFMGTTGVQILSQAELSAGCQAWAKKNQLQSATPVSGGMGMHLLQKMGWKPGEGLGKAKTGALEPLLLEVKLDKKGLVSNEEQKKKKKQLQGWNAKVLQNKHPVSLLGEYASKKKLGAPQYNLCFECGPDHKKNFLFEVILNNVKYKPNVASPNKKEAKFMAAKVCLQHLGLLPAQPSTE